MTESVRKRTSKWDVMEEPEVPFAVENDAPPMIVDDSGKDNVSNSDWHSLKSNSNRVSLPSEIKADPYMMMSEESSAVDKCTERSRPEEDNITIPNVHSSSPHFPKLSDMEGGDRNSSKQVYMEPLSGNQATGNDEEFHRISERHDSAIEQNYITGLSRGRDAWRQRSPTISPRRGWSRSHRSRSRSWSRSRSLSRSRSQSKSPFCDLRRGPVRSRSKSPSYGSRRGPEKWTDRGRMGGGTAVPCRDFAAGRCRRGSECRFLHEDRARRQPYRHYDSGTPDARDSRVERGRYSGQSIKESFSDSREQSDYPRDRFSSNDRPARCYDFTKGRCQRGSACRYSHHEASFDGGRSMRDEARSWTHDRRDGDPSSGRRLEPPKLVSDTPCKYFLDGRCRRGEACKFSHQVVVPHDDRSGYSIGIDSSNSPLNSLNRGDQTAAMDAANSSQWMGNDDDSRVEDSRHNPQFSQSQIPETNIHQNQTQEASNLLTVASVPGQSFGHGGQNQYVVPQPIPGQSYTPNVQIQQLVPPMTLNAPMQQAVFSLHQNGQSQFMAPSAPSNFNSGIQNLPVLPPSHSGQSQQNYNLPPHNGQSQPNFDLSGKIQQNLPLPALNGQSQQNLNFSAQGHQILPAPQNVQNQSLAPQPPSNPQSFNSNEQPMQIADTSDKQPSQISSDTPITQKVVTSEQAAQITNLSASLAQFFGSASALNPQIATGLVPFVQPNQGSLTQQQPIPTSESMGPVNPDINNLPPGFERNDPIIKQSQTNIDSSVPLPITGGTNYGNRPAASVDLEEKVQQRSENAATKEVKEADTLPNKKEQTEDEDADVRKDGESKQSKDAKGMRMFKCSLVDFVKDALKPSWKEGHLSKEAHKTIVKKVVEKVTGAMQSHNVPQTQEKIDLYMLHSKVKLTKLVLAYVEKYVKS